jgi:hypothetical protein
MKQIRTVAAIGGVAVLVAGCGSNAPTSPGGQRSAGGQPPAITHAIAYARCIRAHGVPNYPDPTITHQGNGVGISQGVSAQVAQSPAFNSATHACAKLQPGGAQGQGAQPVSAAQQAQLVTFAACVRRHGVPNMPDPSSSGAFNLPQQVNQNTPAFSTAVKKCLPNGLPLAINQGP